MLLLATNGLMLFRPSWSRAMPMTFAFELAATCLSSGISLMHGWHHVAQKFKTTTFPLSALLLTVVPSSDLSAKLGASLPSTTVAGSGSLVPQPENESTRTKTKQKIVGADTFISNLLESREECLPTRYAVFTPL